jgi:hypothetical protein
MGEVRTVGGEARTVGGEATSEAWALVRTLLDDMAAMVTRESETELELVEGYRVLGRITALSAEVALDVDPDLPWFFEMNSPARMVGGPNPDGAYHLAMIDGARRYRVTGTRNSVTYLGFQVLAGRGLTPRRMAAHVSDADLVLDADGRFALVLSTEEPDPSELDGARWVPVPDDASAIVVRQYLADRSTESEAEFTIAPLDPPGPPDLPTDARIAEQLTAWGWTVAKLLTLHHSVLPEALEHPNVLRTVAAEALGGENTTPDNLYVLGTFRLGPDEALTIEFVPPGTRYWNVSVENIWHECIDPRRRHSSVTNAAVSPGPDGKVRIVVAAAPPPSAVDGRTEWLDTGGRHRGFVCVRWLDNPDPPDVTTAVVPLGRA